MHWRKWKLGLMVAVVTGICTSLAIGAIMDHMSWKQFLVVLAGSSAKDVLLFLKQHPIDSIDTTSIEKGRQ